jgi:hypothetical protein
LDRCGETCTACGKVWPSPLSFCPSVQSSTNRGRIQLASRSADNRQYVSAQATLALGRLCLGKIEAARQRQEKIRVITGIRDPVARSISLIMFLADFYGHTSRPLKPQSEISSDYVIRSLQENWRWVLERNEPNQTFEWILWYFTDAFRTWFASELGAVFGVNILTSTVLGGAASQRISTSAADIFLYRVEDMLPTSAGRSQLLAEASKFLEITVTGFPTVNASAKRRSRTLSEEVRRQFWLPDEMLDAIYGEPIVQHFYSRDEILAFKQRWARKRTTASIGNLSR